MAKNPNTAKAATATTKAAEAPSLVREAVETIILVRNGQRHVINPGTVVEFTQDELDEIESVSPKALSRTSVVNLDDPNGLDLKKLDIPQDKNQTNAPDASGNTGNADDM